MVSTVSCAPKHLKSLFTHHESFRRRLPPITWLPLNTQPSQPIT